MSLCKLAVDRSTRESRKRGGLRGRLALVMAVMTAAFALLLAVPTAAHASSGTSTEPFKTVGSGKWTSDAATYSNCTVSKTGYGSETHVKITLTQDVTLDDFWYITGKYTDGYYVELDLAGHTLQRNLSSKVSDGCVIYMDSKTSLQVMDSAGGGKITGGKNKSAGGGICAENGGESSGVKLTLTNARVTGNESKSYGGGIFLGSYGTLTIEGSSSVDSNTSGNDGGGIYICSHSKFLMSGTSTVTGNDAGSDYGGGICGGGRTAYWLLSGNASVTNNKAKYGGGIYLHDSYVSSRNGLNYLRSDEAVYLRDNFTVSGNSATEDGGGIYLNNASAVYMGGSVSITGNAAKRGGGMYMNTSWFHDAYLIFEDSATPKITGNTVSGSSTASNLQLDARSARLVGMDKLQDGTSIGLTVPDQSEGQSVVKDKTITEYHGSSSNSTSLNSGTVASDRAEGNYFFDDAGTWEFHGVSKGKNDGNYGSAFLCAFKKGSATCPQITKVSVTGISSSDVKTEVNGDQVTVTVPYGTDLTKLTPSYSLAYATKSIYEKWMTKTGSQVDCSQPLTVLVRDAKSGTSYSTPYTVTFKWGEPPTSKIAVTSSKYCNVEVASSAKQDEKVTVKAIPKQGYRFTGWTVEQGGVTLESSNAAETTFTMGAQDVVLTPNVEQIKYTVHFVDSYGDEYYKGEHTVGDTMYMWPDTTKIYKGAVFIEITPPTGYKDYEGGKAYNRTLPSTQSFDLGSVEGQEQGDIYFTLQLEERTYPVSVTGGTIASVNAETANAGTASGDYENGTKLVLAVDESAIPEGMRFKQWKITDTAGQTREGTVSYEGAANLEYTLAANWKSYVWKGNIKFEAEYEADVSQKLTVKGGSGSGSYDPGTTATVSANVPDGYSFDHWEAEGVTLTDAQRTSSSLAVTMPDGSATLAASFKAIDYTLSVTGGSVIEVVRDGADVTATYGGKFHTGDVVTLKVSSLPSGVAAFGGWEETTSGSASVLTYTGTTNEFLFGVGDASVKATYTYALTTVNATSEQKLYKAGDTVTVTAVPGTGESFSGNWTLNGIDESATTKDASAGTISFQMPEGAVIVTAEMGNTDYALTLDGASVAKVVRDGHDITKTYGGKLHTGDLVSMANEEDAQGKEFFYWIADDADTGAAATMQWFTDTEGRDAFIMPAENVKLAAHYTYALTVEGGTCDWYTSSSENMVSCYEPGEEVTLKAKSSLKETFTGWTVVSGLDANSEAYENIAADKTGTVTVALPAPSSGSSVVVRANYKDNPTYSVNLPDGPWGSYCEGEQVTISIDAETFKGWGADYKTTLGLTDWTQKTEGGRVIVTFTMPAKNFTLGIETYALVNYVNLTMDTPTSANIDTTALNLAASSNAEVSGSEVITNSATLVNADEAEAVSTASLLAADGDGEAAALLAADDDETAGSPDDGSFEEDLTLLLSISDAADNPKNVKFASDLVVTYNGAPVHATIADDAQTATVDVTVSYDGSSSDSPSSDVPDKKTDDNAGGSSSGGSSSGSGASGGPTSTAAGKGSKKSMPQTGDTTSYVPIIVAAAVGVAAVIAGIIIHRKRS